MPQRSRSRRAAARQTPDGPAEEAHYAWALRDSGRSARRTSRNVQGWGRPSRRTTPRDVNDTGCCSPATRLNKAAGTTALSVQLRSTGDNPHRHPLGDNASGPHRPYFCAEVAEWWTRRDFDHRLRITPEKPGVYMMKDAGDNVLYVGKAASLKNRIRSYFGSSRSLNSKIQKMTSKVVDFEFIVTDSAAEALILECTLIKKFRPTYNARLKDDKSYPYIKIDLTEDFPQIYVTRRVTQDGARYFGPFATANSIRRTLDLLKKLFPYRSCTKVITGTDARPCLEVLHQPVRGSVHRRRGQGGVSQGRRPGNHVHGGQHRHGAGRPPPEDGRGLLKRWSSSGPLCSGTRFALYRR